MKLWKNLASLGKFQNRFESVKIIEFPLSFRWGITTHTALSVWCTKGYALSFLIGVRDRGAVPVWIRLVNSQPDCR